MTGWPNLTLLSIQTQFLTVDYKSDWVVTDAELESDQLASARVSLISQSCLELPSLMDIIALMGAKVALLPPSLPLQSYEI